MNPAIETMLARYSFASNEDKLRALREILQETALLGLWRGKFFEHAAFYGGTALRVLYGLDRFSEDMDFSLIKPDPGFRLEPYCGFVKDELKAFGFTAEIEVKKKAAGGQVKSAFLKADTLEQLLVIGMEGESGLPLTKIKIEIDTDPPSLFKTEVRALLNPIPFSVKVFAPSSMFAGKMHALLWRGWKTRVKGRDWYDFAWFVGRRTPVNLRHLEQRMRQSGDWSSDGTLTEGAFRTLLRRHIDSVNIVQAKEDISRFLVSPDTVAAWSKDFFIDVAGKVELEL
ncbi:MAG: nucleotidyl transferase AbiEii/AbiGii toxin family protein [Elusimicrobiota bacterium]